MRGSLAWGKGWLVALGLAAGLGGCIALPKPYLTEAETGLDRIPAGHARIFFYGDNLAVRRLDRFALWRPRVTMDGEPVVPGHGRRVAFFVDKEPGTYTLGVDNDVQEGDPPPPPEYRGRELTLAVEAGRQYHVRMIQHGDAFLFPPEPRQYYLSLRQVQDVLGPIEVQRYMYIGPVTDAHWRY